MGKVSSYSAADDVSAASAEATDYPQVFGKYVLLRSMAKGGMGELFLAAAGEIGGYEKLCVVKKVLQDLGDESVRRRFLDEAKVVVRLNHANLVAVFDAGRVSDEHYFSMELVEGKDLRAVWNRCAQLHRRIPVDFATFVVREMCRGLDYVHDAMGLDLVHRDISPPNILVSYHGQIKITDFGLAKHTIKRELTNPGVVFGRYSYLSPEQARGLPADRRTDIYAAGIVLWEMLTGRQLFPAERKGQSSPISELRNPVIRAPSELVPGIPEGLDAVVLRALAVEREDRYQTAGEFRIALSDIVAKHYPTCDVDRVAAIMRDIFGREFKLEGQDYAKFASEDFSPIRLRADLTETLSISDIIVEESDDMTASSITLNENDIVELQEMQVQAGWNEGPSPASLEEAAVSRIGAVVGCRYRIDRLLGVGGMGAVYEVTHLSLGKTYALKVLHDVYGRDPDLIDRFMREARAATQTGHPNIIDVMDIGTMDSGDLYFVMELLEGTDLGAVVAQDGRLSIVRSVHIARQICNALEAAHQAQIIHRDLKSENVMLTTRGRDPDFVKVLDFGICKQVDAASSSQTTPGLVMGSPDYMAPEQAAGAAANVKSDIYALGTILFEMLSGRLPFVGRNAIDVLMQKGAGKAPDIREFCPEVPAPVAELIGRCLALALDDRPDSMRSVDYELTRAMEGRSRAVAAAMGLKTETDGPGTDPPSASSSRSRGSRPIVAEPNRMFESSDSIDGFALQHMSAKLVTVHDQAAATSSEGADRGPAVVSSAVSGVKALLFVALGVALAGGMFFTFGKSAPGIAPSARGSLGHTVTEDAPRSQMPVAVTDGGSPRDALSPSNGQPEGAVSPNLENQAPVGLAGVETSKIDTALLAPDTDRGDGPIEAVVPGSQVRGLPSELVARAESALSLEHWNQPASGSLALELAALNVSDPGNEALLRLRRDAAKILRPRASRALRRKRWKKSADAYRSLLAVWPDIASSDDDVRRDFVVALRNQGRVLKRHKSWDPALSTADELLNIDPDSFAGLKLRADALAGLDRWEEAAPAYRAAMKKNRRNKDAKKGWYRARRMLARQENR